MSTLINNRMMTTEHDAGMARNVLTTLDHPDGFLSVADQHTAPDPLPREIGLLLQHVLKAVANGETVTITTSPAVLTTSEAAALLGISRPTLMKMIKQGKLRSHKVGTHTRLLSEDVLAERRARRARERASFAALLELEDELGM